jgi:IS5 family transposase
MREMTGQQLGLVYMPVAQETLEQVNRLVMELAQQRGVELGDQLRGDCTVSESNIHEPTDSSLPFGKL